MTQIKTENSATSADIAVSAEDQSRICQYSCLSSKQVELMSDLKQNKESLQGVKDAYEEVELLSFEPDDEKVPKTMTMIGDVYISLSDEESLSHLTEIEKKLNLKIQTNEEELEKVKTGLIELKAALYGKFGGLIQLER